MGRDGDAATSPGAQNRVSEPRLKGAVIGKAMSQTNRKLARPRFDGYFDIRVFHRSREPKKDPRFLFKCGCCEERLEVYYGGDSLEINGVIGSVENWRELLVPLLNMTLPGQEPSAKRSRGNPVARKPRRS